MKTFQPMNRADLRLRFLCCVVVMGLTFTGLAARLFYLQVIKGRSYRFQSENNRVRAVRLIPPRGMILDRNGVILADTRAAFDASVIPSEVPSEQESEIFAKVSKFLKMPIEEIEEIVKSRGAAKWKPRLLKRRLTRRQMASLEARRVDLPGFSVRLNPVRHYNYGGLMGVTLGYMGGISPEELASPDFSHYESSDYLGRSGLEKAWEKNLRGIPGGAQIEVDAVGRKLAELARRPPRAGHNVVLTIDKRLQEVCEEALGDEVGSIVVLDIATGEVLALAAMPGFDPNQLARGITDEEWAALSGNPRHPLQNRAIKGLYAPGSTFKIVMALAGLDYGVITPKTKYTCDGKLGFAGRDYRCWKKAGHGEVDLAQALEQSCDVYFYQLGLILGVDNISHYSAKLGLGKVTGIDIPGEKTGLVPSKAWKRRVRNEQWWSGETLSVSIGQGYLLTTPLQLAVMMAGVANPQGKLMRPKIVSRIEDADGNLIEAIPSSLLGQHQFTQTHLMTVREALRRVVHSPLGTGKKATVEGIEVAGKTGTAQVVSLREGEHGMDKELFEWRRRDHALFVSYAPYKDPKIAVAVVIDHGGSGGANAAPVAGEVIRAYMEILEEGSRNTLEEVAF